MCHIFLDLFGCYEAKFSFFKGVSVRFNGLNYEHGGDDIPESLARNINNAPFLKGLILHLCILILACYDGFPQDLAHDDHNGFFRLS